MDVNNKSNDEIYKAILINDFKTLFEKKDEILKSKFLQFYLAISNELVHRFFFNKINVKILQDDFFKHCKDAETMLYVLNNYTLDAHLPSLNNCFYFYILINRLDVVKLLNEKCPMSTKINVNELFLVAIQQWNEPIYDWLYETFNKKVEIDFHKQCKQICEMEILSENMKIFDIVLQNLENGNQKDIDHISRYFHLLITSDKKINQLKFFLNKFKEKITKVKKIDTFQKPMVELTLLENDVLLPYDSEEQLYKFYENMVFYLPFDEYHSYLKTQQKTWSFETFKTLFINQRFENLKKLIYEIKTTNDVYLKSIIFCMQKERIDIIIEILNKSLFTNKEFENEFNKTIKETGCFVLMDLEGPNYFNSLKKKIQTHQKVLDIVIFKNTNLKNI